MRIGLMGGTFDPVHHGHLVLAETARVEFGLDRVIWIPAGDPPHKRDVEVTPQEHRYAMVLLATASHPRFEVSRFEMERQGPSYTIDTLQAFQGRFPTAELFFLIGADAILEVLTWHRHADVMRSCRFLAAGRPGYDLSQLEGLLPASYLSRISLLEGPQLDISSTELRERVHRGQPIRYLVPEPVEGYLRKHRLYLPETPGEDGR